MRAVAAGALLPLAPALLAAEQPQQLVQLQSHLWDILVDSDELSPATGWCYTLLMQNTSWQASTNMPDMSCALSYTLVFVMTHHHCEGMAACAGAAMQLLAATAGGAPVSGVALSDRIPLLLPYFRHTLASVRRSCLDCMDALLQSIATGGSRCIHHLIHMSLETAFCTVQFVYLTSPTNCGGCATNEPVCFAGAATWPRDLLSSMLRLAFQNLLQEEDNSVRAASQQFWQRVLQQLAPTVLSEALPAHTIQVQRHATVARCCTFCMREPSTYRQAGVSACGSKCDTHLTCLTAGYVRSCVHP